MNLPSNFSIFSWGAVSVIFAESKNYWKIPFHVQAPTEISLDWPKPSVLKEIDQWFPCLSSCSIAWLIRGIFSRYIINRIIVLLNNSVNILVANPRLKYRYRKSNELPCRLKRTYFLDLWCRGRHILFLQYLPDQINSFILRYNVSYISYQVAQKFNFQVGNFFNKTFINIKSNLSWNRPPAFFSIVIKWKEYFLVGLERKGI